LKPHAAAGGADLLSTFTGLATLAALDGLHAIDTAGIADFLRNSAHPRGGFLACAGDDAADVEYTYYGTGVVALLRTLP
jgi:geranylgeranyl transferase type-2 subunit beta